MTEAPNPARLRQERIRKRVATDGYARIDDLAATFGVSVMTIHRDLDHLQSQGWLRKVRGGATAVPGGDFHGTLQYRMATMLEAKNSVAARATELIDQVPILMLDESTTAFSLARRLPALAPLTVVTNSLPITNLLAQEAGIELFTIGGTYFAAYEAFLGLHAAKAVRSLRAKIFFASTTAISGGRCFHQSQETVHVKQAMFEACEKRVLLIDHTKFEKNGLYEFAALEDFDHVIVDDGISAHDLDSLRASGVNVAVAPTAAPEGNLEPADRAARA